MAKENNKTVVVGFTGRIDSVVAAYLLKKQGFNCIGICIQQIDPSRQTPLLDKILAQCQIKQINQAQRICNELEIPFYAVNAHEPYNANIIEFVVAKRLSGESFTPCVACNKMKIEILWEKAQKLGASWVATGHYAKIGLNQRTGDRYLVSAGSNEEDQSIVLSGLEAKYLERMLLPLGDMRKSEVEKIAASLNLGLTGNASGLKNCFGDTASVSKYIEGYVAKSLRPDGEIINAEDGSILGTHKGIYNYSLGQSHILVKPEETPIDPHMKVISLNVLQRRIYLANIAGLEFEYCSLAKFISTYDIDWTKPMMCYAQFYGIKDRFPCLLSRKANNTVLLEFSNRHCAFISTGLSVAVFNKNIPGAKLIGSGTLGQFGFFQKIDRTSGSDDKLDERREKIRKQKDISLF